MTRFCGTALARRHGLALFGLRSTRWNIQTAGGTIFGAMPIDHQCGIPYLVIRRQTGSGHGKRNAPYAQWKTTTVSSGKVVGAQLMNTGEILGLFFEFIRKSPDDGTPQYWRAPADTRLADTVWSGVRIYNNSTNYPTEKHEALLRQVVELASSPGDIVLDAFAGSGTTLVAAEKLGRRWVGIDCGKLSIYTVQKRMLNLRDEIVGKSALLKPKAFGLYNAGLYDFSKLKELSWDAWHFFALQLFQCRDEVHKIGGIQLDGYLKGSSVLVFNHQKTPGVRIDEETIQSMHDALGSKIGSRMFIIAPALVFDFQQDYLALDGVRYYALRIAHSILDNPRIAST
jgi:hypothetical protein